MELRAPLAATWNADTDPAPAPACALDTYRCEGFAGENSLPNGPAASAGNGEPAAGVIRPLASTVKLSIKNVLAEVVPTSTPIRFVPFELNRPSPRLALLHSPTLEPLLADNTPPPSPH